jgi:hypothetical protein
MKCDVAILATSGKEWSERTDRLAARVPKLEIFSQQLVERLEGGWRITSDDLRKLPPLSYAVFTDCCHPSKH